MRASITIVILLITLSSFAQNQSSWNYNFSYLSDAPLEKSSPVSTSEIPTNANHISQAQGWTTGIDKTILLKHYLKVNAGVNFTKKTYFHSDHIVDSPLSRSAQRKSDHYYLSTPITIQYSKGKVVSPSLTIEPGFQVFNRIPLDQSNYFSRQPLGNYLKIMPGAEIQISERVKLFMGASLTNYNFFGSQPGKWCGGFQIGLKITLGKRKNQ